MRCVAIIAALSLPGASQASDVDLRARAALALALAIQERAPEVKPLTQEERWRRDGWQQDASGQWYRRIPGRAEGRAASGRGLDASRPAPVYFAPARDAAGC